MVNGRAPHVVDARLRTKPGGWETASPETPDIELAGQAVVQMESYVGIPEKGARGKEQEQSGWFLLPAPA